MSMTKEEYRKRNAERRAKENWERTVHKSQLELEFGLKGHPKADLLYQIAWSMGHAYGFHEVANYYHELAPLLQED